MIKNVSKWIMLLGLFAFLLPSCSISRRSPANPSRVAKKPTMTKEAKLRQDLLSYAHQFKGARYKYGGNGPKHFDCSGLTYKVYQNFNIDLPRTSSSQASTGRKVPMNRAKPGDLAFFRKGTNSGKINHVALVIGYTSDGLKVIHSTTSKGVIVENISHSTYWKARFLYVRSVLGN